MTPPPTLADPDIGLCDDCGSDAGRRHPTAIECRINGELRRLIAWLCADCKRDRLAARPTPDHSDNACPRCDSTELQGLTGVSAGCEWSQTLCDNCGHRWGDGLPDEAERPLPDGYGVCGSCDGEGSSYGRDCRVCGGRGIVASPVGTWEREVTP